MVSALGAIVHDPRAPRPRGLPAVPTPAAAAVRTRRIGLATGIALAFTRSPLVMALEALDLDELSEGRAVLGLGAGARRLNRDWHAVDFPGLKWGLVGRLPGTALGASVCLMLAASTATAMPIEQDYYSAPGVTSEGARYQRGRRRCDRNGNALVAATNGAAATDSRSCATR